MTDQSVRPADTARVVEIARRLIRFDTTNPPGNERACIEYIAELLHCVGLGTPDRRQRIPSGPISLSGWKVGNPITDC
ncbi:hypothetical protein [Nocardia sp. NPDC004711]